MEINRENMNTLFQGFNRSFQSGIQLMHTEYQRFSMSVPSTTASVLFPFLLKWGGMREWVGDRQLKDIESASMEVFHKDYEDSVKVDANNLEDDQYGLYSPMFEDLGFSAQEIWGELAVGALLAGETDLWQIDGKTFFSTNRFYGQNAIVNKTTDALSTDAYRAARIAMQQYKAHNGAKMKVRPGLLCVGPSNEQMAFDITKASKKQVIDDTATTTVSIAQDNDLKGTAEVMVLPDLDAQWFLMDVSRPFKPVAVAKRKQAVLARLDKKDDANVFMSREYYYGTHARGTAFLTMPHMVYAGNL